MLLFIKSLPRMVRSASKDISRHFSTAFSSSLSIAIALLIAMFMTVMAASIDQFTKNIESEFVVQVSLLPTVTEEQRQVLTDELSSMKGAGHVTYSTKDQELDELIAQNGEIFSQYAGEDRNPLLDVLTVHLENAQQMEAVSKEAAKLDGVASVSYGGSMISKMVDVFDAARTGGWLLVGFMIILAVYLTRISVKMTIHTRQEEIAIMRQVGAYNWYITTPFVFEGLIIGFWGALVPGLLVLLGYPALYNLLGGVLLSDMFVLISPWPFAAYVTAGVFGIGLLTGALGSWLAVRKYLRWYR
ncbi:permease-like cell division protein FtsX [Faecalibaculum rodentium]|jgi:cell division transport system permease protein|uniref:permease-like cell division protein FtsX n=1 Tax=Faecalibaculum rodentium TaxID=1702221 RepID=UPI001C3CE480|nr:permease-like cell division protein FtsX [Faecalibaculum rodentium]